VRSLPIQGTPNAATSSVQPVRVDPRRAHIRTGGDEAQLLDNLRVLAGEAEYGRPEIQQTENEVAAQPPPRICKNAVFPLGLIQLAYIRSDSLDFTKWLPESAAECETAWKH
jgi:hypothetical protein